MSRDYYKEYYVVVFYEIPTLEAMTTKSAGKKIDVAIMASNSETETLFYVREKGTKKLVETIKSQANLYNQAIFSFEKNKNSLDIYKFNGDFQSLLRVLGKNTTKFCINHDY